MGSNHRCVMAKFEIPKERGKPRHSKAPTTEREGDMSDDELQHKYKDLRRKSEMRNQEKAKSLRQKKRL